MNGSVTVDCAYLLLRISPLQCLTSPVLVRSPFPSHPTVRSVFPNTAVRQSSPSTVHRFRPVLQLAAADIGEAHRIPLAIRIALPSKPPAFTSLGEIATNANVDEALQSPKCLAGVRVTKVVDPSRHQRIDLGHEFLGTDRRPSRGKVLQLVADRLLGGLGWEEINGLLACRGTFALDELDAEEVKPLG